MFCGQCGAELLAGDRFCRECGAQVEQTVNEETIYEQPVSVPTEPPIVSAYEEAPKKKGKTTIIVTAIIILIAILAAVLLLTKGTGTKKQYEDLLASGNRYLEELDYENAEIAFLEAIKVDPKKPDAYIQLADVYVDQGKIDEAEEILDEADEIIDDEAIDNKIDEISSYSGYEWYLEPSVEADNIYYIMDFNELLNDTYRPFYNEYAVVEKNGRYGLIDMGGGIVNGDANYRVIKTFYNEYYFEDMNGQYFTFSNGQIEPLLGRGMAAFCFYYSDRLYEIYDYDMWTMYELERTIEDIAIPVKYSDSIYNSMTDVYWTDWVLGLESKYAIYYDGQLTTDFIYDECGSFSGGRMAACLEGKWGYVDENGNTIIPFEYDASWCQFAPYTGKGLWFYEEETDYCYAFSEGFVPLVKDGVWELRDIDGNVVLKPGIFEEIRPVYDNKCWVKKDGKWGVIELVFRGEDDSEGVEETVDLSGITVEFERTYESALEYSTITAYDESGAVIWSYQTQKYDAAQLDRTSEITIHEDKYYFVEGGTIKALSLAEGSLVWENTEFGGSPSTNSWDFDENGTLYISGFFGPDFFAVDKNGKTLKKIDMLSNDYYWPYELEYADGQVIVTLDGGPEGDGANAKCFINTDDYTYSF